jgi:pimeloyl-ACP methyl ester carboxylesterase
MRSMAKASLSSRVASSEPRMRRGYFECRFGQLHVHNAIPPGGGFEEGTSLLCLHPAAMSGRVFQRFLPLMGQDRSVYAPDLPGCGESDAPPARASVGDHSAAIGDFLDSMRFRQIDVLGYHAGALVAIELAIARPQQIRRIVLVGLPEGARERISLVVSQQIMVLRPKDDLWEATQRVRERLPKARFIDLPDQGATLFEAAAEVVANAVKDFQRS